MNWAEVIAAIIADIIWREHVALALIRAIEEAACMHDDYPGVAEV